MRLRPFSGNKKSSTEDKLRDKTRPELTSPKVPTSKEQARADATDWELQDRCRRLLRERNDLEAEIKAKAEENAYQTARLQHVREKFFKAEDVSVREFKARYESLSRDHRVLIDKYNCAMERIQKLETERQNDADLASSRTTSMLDQLDTIQMHHRELFEEHAFLRHQSKDAEQAISALECLHAHAARRAKSSTHWSLYSLAGAGVVAAIGLWLMFQP